MKSTYLGHDHPLFQAAAGAGPVARGRPEGPVRVAARALRGAARAARRRQRRRRLRRGRRGSHGGGRAQAGGHLPLAAPGRRPHPHAADPRGRGRALRGPCEARGGRGAVAGRAVFGPVANRGPIQ